MRHPHVSFICYCLTCSVNVKFSHIMFNNYCLKCVLTIFWALNFVVCMQSMKLSMAHIKSQVTLSEATLHHLSGSCVVASMAL